MLLNDFPIIFLKLLSMAMGVGSYCAWLWELLFLVCGAIFDGFLDLCFYRFGDDVECFCDGFGDLNGEWKGKGKGMGKRIWYRQDGRDPCRPIQYLYI